MWKGAGRGVVPRDPPPVERQRWAFDGPRDADRARASASASRSARTAFDQVSLARSVRDQPRVSSSAMRFG